MRLLREAEEGINDSQLMAALINQGEAFLKANMVVLDPMTTKPVVSLASHPNVQWDSNGSTDSVLLKDWEKGQKRVEGAFSSRSYEDDFDVFKALTGGALKREESSACGPM